MKTYILNNLPSIILILAALVYVVVMAAQGKWTKLREQAYEFIKLAEKSITGTQKGREKFDWVFKQLYNMLPPWARFILPENTAREKLQEWYIQIKDELDDGQINGSVIQ
jgi:hypothetical protein